MNSEVYYKSQPPTNAGTSSRSKTPSPSSPSSNTSHRIAGHYPKGIAFYKWLAEKGWDESQALKSAAGDKEA